MESGTRETLLAIWGSGPTDVFAVGNDGTILHFDGSAWSPMTSSTSYDVSGVWGSGPDDVYAVGSYYTYFHYSSGTLGTTYETNMRSVILHYDGASWTQSEPLWGHELESVWGSGPDNVLCAGVEWTYFSRHARIMYFEQGQWLTQALGANAHLTGLWGSGPQDIYAVGYSGTILHQGPQYALTVDTIGQGSVEPSGGVYAAGTELTLTATPDADWRFAGWGDDLSGTENPVAVTMDADRAVVAEFAEEPDVDNGDIDTADPGGGDRSVEDVEDGDAESENEIDNRPDFDGDPLQEIPEELLPPGCGPGACGAGVVGYVPLTLFGLCGLKLGARRRCA